MYGTLISTQTLTGTAASVTFSSIPGTYTDLVLVISARSTYSTTDDQINIAYNGTTANQPLRYLQGTGSVALSGNSANYPMAGYMPGATTTANTFGNTIITLPNYSGSTNKVLSADSVDENNAAGAAQLLVAGGWSSTAAITSIALTSNNGGNFAAGSTFSLYGLTHF
jgi:hypothetical protein